MKQIQVQLDSRCRTLLVGDRRVVLQEKVWQVLFLLVIRAPEVVSRQDFVREVWHGSFLTGEKGLNQAIWTIRSVLTDDSRQPEFIRTVPRIGYQWIHSNTDFKEAGPLNPGPHTGLIAAGIAGFAITIAMLLFTGRDVALSDTEHTAEPASLIATKAYLVNEDVHVQLASGCLGILKSTDEKTFGAPLLSADGKEVAVAVYEPKGCRLVTIDVANRKLRDYSECPAT